MTWKRALLALTVLFAVPLNALAGEAADRVRVDLDFEQLGIADGTGGPVVVEIHCRGGHALHQVRMDGDVLVVQTRALPDSRTSGLDVSAAQGIGVSFDGRAPAAPMPPAPPAAPAAPPRHDDLGLPPTLDHIPPPWDEGSAPAAPTPPEAQPQRLPDSQPFSPQVPIPAPAPPPTAAPAEIPAPGGDGTASSQLSADAAKHEVMAAMEAAMAEARLESEARLEEARYAGEYGEQGDNHNSKWVVEKDL
jgi:hypothetical protein